MNRQRTAQREVAQSVDDIGTASDGNRVAGKRLQRFNINFADYRAGGILANRADNIGRSRVANHFADSQSTALRSQ